MWYTFAQELQDKADIINPETIPLKPNHIRAFHSIVRPPKEGMTSENVVDSIRQNGLSLNNALGSTYAEPNFVWGTTSWEGRYNPRVTNIEFQVPHEDIRGAQNPCAYNWSDDQIRDWTQRRSQILALCNSVPPENIIAIHEPWHEHVRYFQDNKDSWDKFADMYNTGKFPKEYQRAWEYIRDRNSEAR